jgi:hypothetical protein
MDKVPYHSEQASTERVGGLAAKEQLPPARRGALPTQTGALLIEEEPNRTAAKEVAEPSGLFSLAKWAG